MLSHTVLDPRYTILNKTAMVPALMELSDVTHRTNQYVVTNCDRNSEGKRQYIYKYQIQGFFFLQRLTLGQILCWRWVTWNETRYGYCLCAGNSQGGRNAGTSKDSGNFRLRIGRPGYLLEERHLLSSGSIIYKEYLQINKKKYNRQK